MVERPPLIGSTNWPSENQCDIFFALFSSLAIKSSDFAESAASHLEHSSPDICFEKMRDRLWEMSDRIIREGGEKYISVVSEKCMERPLVQFGRNHGETAHELTLELGRWLAEKLNDASRFLKNGHEAVDVISCIESTFKEINFSFVVAALKKELTILQAQQSGSFLGLTVTALDLERRVNGQIMTASTTSPKAAVAVKALIDSGAQGMSENDLLNTTWPGEVKAPNALTKLKSDKIKEWLEEVGIRMVKSNDGRFVLSEGRE
jgi:hypothetical protein